MSTLLKDLGEMIPMTGAVLTGVGGVLAPIYRWGARMGGRLDKIELSMLGGGGEDPIPSRVRGIEVALAGIKATLERIEIGLNKEIAHVEYELSEHLNKAQDEAHFVHIIRKY